MSSREPPIDHHNSCAFEFDTEFVIAMMAERQIQRGIERGEFDNLPGSGKPLNLPEQHDPDWWFKALLKREGIALMPLSILVRKEDAKLDDELDKMSSSSDVRREIEAFNDLVIRARYYPAEGPPMVTQPRDVDETVAAWADRRTARIEENRRKAREALAESARATRVKTRWRPFGRRARP